jgi:hypothetical protein
VNSGNRKKKRGGVVPIGERCPGLQGAPLSGGRSLEKDRVITFLPDLSEPKIETFSATVHVIRGCNGLRSSVRACGCKLSTVVWPPVPGSLHACIQCVRGC